MADQLGSPEREMEVTSQPLPTATLHIREPGVVSILGRIVGNDFSHRESHCLRRLQSSSPSASFSSMPETTEQCEMNDILSQRTS